MLYVSGVWKGSIINGLDLVDVTLFEVATTKDIHFRRGNLYGFLVEVRHALTPHVIDDQIFFPYNSPPTKGESRNSLYLDAPVDLDSEARVFDESDDTSNNDEWAVTNSTFLSDRASSNDTQLIPPAATLTRNKDMIE